jgi:hypothetical protein
VLRLLEEISLFNAFVASHEGQQRVTWSLAAAAWLDTNQIKSSLRRLKKKKHMRASIVQFEFGSYTQMGQIQNYGCLSINQTSLVRDL